MTWPLIAPDEPTLDITSAEIAKAIDNDCRDHQSG
jgi:hypothetical protein